MEDKFVKRKIKKDGKIKRAGKTRRAGERRAKRGASARSLYNNAAEEGGQ